MFDIAALIDQPNESGQCDYFILYPEEEVLRTAYNKECDRLGKKPVL